MSQKKWSNSVPAEIRVVGSYTDHLLKIPRFKDSSFRSLL